MQTGGEAHFAGLRHVASAEHAAGNPFSTCNDLEGANWEWKLQFPAGGRGCEILCCPEDVQLSARCKHNTNTLCPHCEIPLCKTCFRHCCVKTDENIAMGLANDNFWGYTILVLYKYQVPWVEAAIVTPIWSTMIVYYVESDGGQLMTELFRQQQARTVVRGSCFSYHMPGRTLWNSCYSTVVIATLTKYLGLRNV